LRDNFGIALLMVDQKVLYRGNKKIETQKFI
jgi:hypothetical protein